MKENLPLIASSIECSGTRK
ncbi:unnamed protein product, partial [Rotaria sp. Silwood1]